MMKYLIAAFIWFPVLMPTIAQTFPANPGGTFDSALTAKANVKPMIVLGDASMPPISSLRRYCPTPPNQGMEATCTGWSVAYGARTIREAVKQNARRPEEIAKLVFDPYFVYNSLRNPDDHNCTQGVLLNEALDLLVQQGALPGTGQLNCNSAIDSQHLEAASAHRIRGYELVFGWQDKDQEEVVKNIKMAVAGRKPVVCNILTYFPPHDKRKVAAYEPSFWSVQERWEPTAEETNYSISQLGGPHNVVIVGFDDNRYGGAFEIMNSYGTEWGNGGFFWISYADFMKVKNVGFSVD